jgi:hypothetical protein
VMQSKMIVAMDCPSRIQSLFNRLSDKSH